MGKSLLQATHPKRQKLESPLLDDHDYSDYALRIQDKCYEDWLKANVPEVKKN